MRVLTRSDFDGLACCVLLKKAGMMDDVKFIHPKDVQDGKVDVASSDILANVPYAPGCGMWFDHHSSEVERTNLKGEFKGESRMAPSAARIIYDYFGGKDMFGKLEEFVTAVDKTDSAKFTKEEILKPEGWVLLSFIMDPRTGLGRYHDFRISNIQLMMNMIEYCYEMSIDQILSQQDVKERINKYREQDELFRKMIHENTRIERNVIITDLRGREEIYIGNRFIIYVMYPEQNISIWLIDGKQKENAVFAVGASIINKTCKSNIGSLMLHYGGGGHKKVGGCQVPYSEVDRVLAELIDEIKEDA